MGRGDLFFSRGKRQLLSYVRALLHNESEVVETGSREKKKKMLHSARRLLVYRASHFYRRTVKPLTLSGLSNPIRTNRNIRSTITKTLRLSA